MTASTLSTRESASNRITYTGTAATVGTTAASMFSLELEGGFNKAEIAFSVPAGSGTFNSFTVYTKPHEDATNESYLSGTQFDSENLVTLDWCTTIGPHEVAAEQSAAFKMDVSGLRYIDCYASVASGSAEVIPYITVTR